MHNSLPIESLLVPCPAVLGCDTFSDPDYPLVIRLRHGDPLAFEQLVQKYKQPIVNFAARMLRDLHEAEDVSQNVFVQAFRSLAQFQFAAKVSSWLYLVARNLCLNELRRRSRHPLASIEGEHCTTALHDQIEDNHIRPAYDALLHAELVEIIEHAIASLPEPQRTAILLFRDGHLSYVEIAKRLQLSLPATKSLIHRGRVALKRKLGLYCDIKAA
jgi:RNA polymerase sigma-70 factor (ECF subfamily)